MCLQWEWGWLWKLLPQQSYTPRGLADPFPAERLSKPLPWQSGQPTPWIPGPARPDLGPSVLNLECTLPGGDQKDCPNIQPDFGQ